MIKIIFILATLMSIGGYLYFSDSHKSGEIDASLEASSEVRDHLNPSKNILAEKKLHEAFSQILDKNESDARTVASQTDVPATTLESEYVDQSSNSIQSEGDFEQEFSELPLIDREKVIQNLRFEITQDERLLEQMELDQQSGLKITEADIAAITQRAENKKMKLDAFMSMMNAHEE